MREPTLVYEDRLPTRNRRAPRASNFAWGETNVRGGLFRRRRDAVLMHLGDAVPRLTSAGAWRQWKEDQNTAMHQMPEAARSLALYLYCALRAPIIDGAE